MPEPKKPPFAGPVFRAAPLDVQIQRLREIVERAEALLARLERHEAFPFPDTPPRRRVRSPVH